jgi:PAS domain S-box-containing protein
MAVTPRRVRDQAKRSLSSLTGPARFTDRRANRLIESSRTGLLVFDRQYRYTLWNAAMERLSGVSRAAVLGRSALEVFPFLWSIGEDVYFARALAGHATEAHNRPFSFPQTGREGYFHAWYMPLRDQFGTVVGAIGVIRDVTRRRKRRKA